jgi:phenolic acid decarboxylase
LIEISEPLEGIFIRQDQIGARSSEPKEPTIVRLALILTIKRVRSKGAITFQKWIPQHTNPNVEYFL